jgi:urate oxidase / 2-oxo-4-hydroxy-4-carboxy-5-ureidoimidazoline decarboxylase
LGQKVEVLFLCLEAFKIIDGQFNTGGRMRHLLSGNKQSYYGKGEVVVYRLHRDHKVPAGEKPILAAKVTQVIWGDTFWKTYTEGDNTNLIATDSMKNFIQHETLNYTGYTLEGLLYFLGHKFLIKYPQAEGMELNAEEVPYDQVGDGIAFKPSTGPKAAAQLWLGRENLGRENNAIVIKDMVSGLKSYQLLRLSGSAFYGFIRDEYTTLPEMKNRPLRMFLDLEWRYGDAINILEKTATRKIHSIIEKTFQDFTSGSIQEVIYQMGQAILKDCPEVIQVDLEGQNHTWDKVAEQDDTYGVFTESKPFYGILGLSLKR